MTDKDPVVQVDFAFLHDDSSNEAVNISCCDILSSTGGMAVIPSKAVSTYSVTIVKTSVFEVGRTHGFIQCGKEKPKSRFARQWFESLED